eukprot:gene1854-3600_t
MKTSGFIIVSIFHLCTSAGQINKHQITPATENFKDNIDEHNRESLREKPFKDQRGLRDVKNLALNAVFPTGLPSALPSGLPSGNPSAPTGIPSGRPSSMPSFIPTPFPTVFAPTQTPTIVPTPYPTPFYTHCFNPNIAKNGDFITATVQGFNVQYPWEIFWQALIKDSGELYTGTYQSAMSFAFLDNNGSYSIQLVKSVFLQKNILDKCESCTLNNKQGSQQWYPTPTAAPTVSSHPSSTNAPVASILRYDSNGNIYDPTAKISSGSISDYIYRDQEASTSTTSSADGVDGVIEEEFLTSSHHHRHKGRKNRPSLFFGTEAEMDQIEREEEEEEQVSASDTPTRSRTQRQRQRGLDGESDSEGDGDVQLMLTLWGHNNTWYSPDRYGASYDVSDVQGHILYYSGTLCGINDGKYPEESDSSSASGTFSASSATSTRSRPKSPPLRKPPRPTSDSGGGTTTGVNSSNNDEGITQLSGCEIKLPKGDYLFRVRRATSYPHSDEMKWRFCNVIVYGTRELKFRVNSDGSCTPLLIKDAAMYCTQNNNNIIIDTNFILLKGSISLGGMQIQNTLSEQDSQVLRSAISLQFSEGSSGEDVSDEDVQITSWNIIGDVINDNDNGDVNGNGLKDFPLPIRKLSDRKGRLSFTVRLTSENYGVNMNANEKSSALELVEGMKAFLQGSMSSGVFVAKIVSQAHGMRHVGGIQGVNFAELVDLAEIHQTRINEEMTDISNMVVIVGALTGLVFGAIMYRSYRRRGDEPVVSYSLVMIQQQKLVKLRFLAFTLGEVSKTRRSYYGGIADVTTSFVVSSPSLRRPCCVVVVQQYTKCRLLVDCALFW